MKTGNDSNAGPDKLVIIVYGREPTQSTDLITKLSGINYVEIYPPPPWVVEQFSHVVEDVWKNITNTLSTRKGDCTYMCCVECI